MLHHIQKLEVILRECAVFVHVTDDGWCREVLKLVIVTVTPSVLSLSLHQYCRHRECSSLVGFSVRRVDLSVERWYFPVVRKHQRSFSLWEAQWVYLTAVVVCLCAPGNVRIVICCHMLVSGFCCRWCHAIQMLWSWFFPHCNLSCISWDISWLRQVQILLS